MSLLKNLTIKISSSEEIPSSNTENREKKEEYSYCLKVLFPDEDSICYLLNEVGLNTGSVKKFSSIDEAEHYAHFNGLKNYTIEKI